MNKQTVYEQYYNDESTKNAQFDLYAYSPPAAFRFEADGTKSPVIKDFRTLERYQEYKDCGFNIMLTQTSAVYWWDMDWETSDTKAALDRAQAVGLKCIILDERIRQLSKIDGGIIGEGKQFASEAELDKHVAMLMEPYKDHPAFYGVQFLDEPQWVVFKTFGQLYKSIKRVHPQTFIQCNLLPVIVLNMTNRWFPEGLDLFDRFKRYLELFLDETGADYVMYDNYPIYNGELGDGKCFYRFYFKALQVATQVCKERGVKLYFVMQSFAMIQRGMLECVTPNEAQMFYQANALMGFGAKQLSYYTYWTSGLLNVNGEIRPDGSAMMSRMGEKMPLWYSVQKVNAMLQKLAPVILNFEYEADRYIIKPPFKTHPFHLEYTGRCFLDDVEAETSQEVAMVYQLKDKRNSQRLYVVQNITYNYYEEKLGLPKQKTTLKFDKKYTKIDIFDGETWRTEQPKNGEYTAELAAGYAEYILPY